ncbi:hypothetical protein NNRS527_02677 [Nitrosospira sp. NRS527]|nr:hypothetical protein NNRS527_02677 [Nitrosospira sp. NRS527]
MFHMPPYGFSRMGGTYATHHWVILISSEGDNVMVLVYDSETCKQQAISVTAPGYEAVPRAAGNPDFSPPVCFNPMKSF